MRIAFAIVVVMLTGSLVWHSGAEAAAAQKISRTVFFASAGREVFGVAVAEVYAKKDLPDYQNYSVVPEYSVEEKNGSLRVSVKGRAAFLDVAGKWRSQPLGSLLQQVEANYENGSTVFAIKRATQTKYEVLPVKRRYSFVDDDNVIVQTFVAVRVTDKLDADILVAVDPGHGGPEDLGTCGNNIYEKDVNMDIALMLRDYLTEEGFGVYMTRERDVDLDLPERSESANLLGADVFVSVHNNAFDPQAFDAKAAKMYKGTTVLYNSLAAKPAKDLAIIMNDKLVDALRTHEYPVQNRPGLSVLNSTWMPSVLAECTMFPNNGDAKLITDRVNRQKAARAMAEAICEYLRGGKLTEFQKKDAVAPKQSVYGVAANHNLAVFDGDWIYYCEAAGDTYGGSDNRMYRVRPDGSGQIKGETYIEPFCADSASGLCLFNGYLYYENWSDGQKIYRIKTDGSGKELVSNAPARWLQRSGVWLIYAKSEIKTASKNDNALFKRSLITGEETLLARGGAENVCVDNGYVYYLNWSDGYKIWRVSLAGGAPVRVSDCAATFFVVADGKVYYTNYNDGGRIYSCAVNGSNASRIAPVKNVAYMLWLNEHIYYTRVDAAGLWNLDINSGKIEQITAIAGGPINSAAGLLYYRTLFIAQ